MRARCKPFALFAAGYFLGPRCKCGEVTPQNRSSELRREFPLSVHEPYRATATDRRPISREGQTAASFRLTDQSAGIVSQAPCVSLCFAPTRPAGAPLDRQQNAPAGIYGRLRHGYGGGVLSACRLSH